MTVWRWLKLRPWLCVLVIVVVGQLGVIRAIQGEAASRRQSQCRDSSEARADVRRIVKRASIASGVEGGEALILTFPTADQSYVDLLRANLTEQLDPALTEIVNDYPDRQWVDGECVDVPVEP